MHKAKRSPTSERPVAVISLHGIRTRGKWQKELTEQLSKKGFVHYPLDYGFFWALALLIPSARRKKVKWFLDEYTRIVKESQNPSVIAHSFGSYIVARSMEMYAEVQFDQVILCGSIVRRDYQWHERFGTQTSRVLNDYGRLDVWARLVGWFVEDAGDSGLVGFTNTSRRLVQREHPEFRHSDYFYELNYTRNWIPFLQHKTPKPLVAAQRRPRNWKYTATVIATAAVVLFLATTSYSLLHRRSSTLFTLNKPASVISGAFAQATEQLTIECELVVHSDDPDFNPNNLPLAVRLSMSSDFSEPLKDSTLNGVHWEEVSEPTRRFRSSKFTVTYASSEMPERVFLDVVVHDGGTETHSAPVELIPEQHDKSDTVVEWTTKP